MMKKMISLCLAAIMLASVLSLAPMNALANGWLDYVKTVKLDTWYSESFSYTDYSSSNEDAASDQFKFTLPKSGTVEIKIKCEPSTKDDYYKNYFYWLNKINIYSSTNTANEIFCESPNPDGFDSSTGYYYETKTVNLSAGTYYLRYLYYDYVWDTLTGQYDIMLKYKPSFSNTSLSKVSAKKKAFTAKWNKASGVTGYQIQYSLKKNMKGAKTVTVKKASSVSKTVKKLKRKKKYYVRIRTYKTLTVEGVRKTYYGKWSAKKSVKTK